MIDQVHNLDYKDLLAKIPSGSVALVLTDPIYGIGYSNNFTKSKFEVLQGDEESFSYATLAQEAQRILRDDSAIFAYTGWSEYPMHFNDLKAAGFAMKEPLIAQKRASGTHDLKGAFQTNADWIMFGHKGRFQFRPTQLVRNKRGGTVPNPGRKPIAEFKTRFPSCWFGEEYPWSSENPTNEYAKQHPTVKGQEFIEWLIKMSTDEGDTVVDPFVGSGTVAAAAKATGRRFIAGDVSAEFCAIARKRLGIVAAEAFPPVGWFVHKDDPRYFHNYKEVLTEAQLRARIVAESSSRL